MMGLFIVQSYTKPFINNMQAIAKKITAILPHVFTAGDFGLSLIFRQDITPKIAERIKNKTYKCEANIK